MAVGFLNDRLGIPTKLFSERWNGSSWSIVTMPSPSRVAHSFLGGVACTSTSACIAVGNTSNSVPSPTGTLAERWNGTRWRIMSIPDPPGAPGAYLPTVSCPSASLCFAAGSSANSSGFPTATIVERWDGRHWTIVPTPPKPVGVPGAEIDAIACTSSSSCLAAGALDYPPNQQQPLAEHWDGAHWTILSTPKPPHAQGGVLSGVACTSQTACTISGLASTNSGRYLYADRWNGAKFTFQSTPALPDALDIGNPVLACPSASTCMAVGAFTNTFPNGPKFGLAEHWER
jgi:hypothetical protein